MLWILIRRAQCTHNVHFSGEINKYYIDTISYLELYSPEEKILICLGSVRTHATTISPTLS